MTERSALRQQLSPLLTLATAGLLLHGRELFGARPIWRDIQQYYAPVKFYIEATLRAGELPQWWPWDAAGTPLLAQPQFSFFHPTTLFYVLLPFWKAFAAQSLVATWLGLFGTYVLARMLRLPPWASVIAGAAFGASGYLTSLNEHTFMALSAGTMPWYCAALLHAHRRRGIASLLPGIAMSLLLVAGDPQIAIMASASGLILLLVEPEGASPRSLSLAFLSPVAGALLAAIQLVPSLLLAPETERGSVLKNINQWAFEWRHLWGMLVPVNHGPTDFAPSTFLGPASLVLAGVTLLSRKERRTIFALWGIALISVWLALGDSFLLNALAKAVVPFWGQFRFPIKAILPGFLVLSLLAGFGAHLLADPEERTRVLRWAGAGAAIALLIVAFSGVGVADIATLATVLVVALAAGRDLRLAAWLIAVESVAFAIVVHPLVDADYYREPDMSRLLKQRGVGLTGPAMDDFDWSVRPAEQDMALRSLVGGGGRSSYGAFFGLPSVSSYSPSASRRMRSIEDVAWNDNRAGLFGVRYAVLREPVPPTLQTRVLARIPAFDTALVELPRSLARAYAVRRARQAKTPDEAVALLSAPDFKPGREIVVDGAWNPEWAARPDSPSVPATFLSRTNSTIVLEAELPWPGFVALNEAYFSGWSAAVDGVPTTILPANGAMRAVEVPQGVHRVKFHYQTPGLVTGAVISAVAWLLMALMAVRLRRRQ